MLIVSPALVLSQAEAAFPAGTPLILWNSLVTTTNVTGGGSLAGYPESNMANSNTNSEWRTGPLIGSGDIEIIVTHGSLEEIDGVGIARHNLGTNSSEIDVGYYDNNSPPLWVSLVGPQIAPDDKPLLFQFTPQVVPTLVIRLFNNDLSGEGIRIAVLYVGKLLIMERSIDIGADFAVPRFARKSEVVNGMSERGDYLGRVITSQWLEGIRHDYKHLRPDWYRTNVDPFILAAQTDTPFFYAWSPDDYPYEVVLAWLNDDPVVLTSPVTQRVHLTLNMGGILE